MQNRFKKFRKIPLFVSIILLVLSGYVFSFLYKKIGENKTTARAAQIEWQTEATRRDEIRSLEHSIRDISKERILLESHFAKSSDVVPFLDTIEQLAKKVGANPEIVSVDIPKDKTGLLVGLKASGSFESIYKFLMLLENSPYELEFVSADMQHSNTQIVSDKKGEVPRWEAVLKIRLISFEQ